VEIVLFPTIQSPKNLQAIHVQFTYVVRAKGLEGRIALPSGGFFHQGSQQEERFPCKPSSQELGDSIGFGIKWLKTLNTLKD
jgi:hypothetical protein